MYPLVKVKIKVERYWFLIAEKNLFYNLNYLFLDVNECASSQCDLASTECINTPGAFMCKCKSGFASIMECRPIGDLGLINGGIPDESITVSSSENGYTKSVCIFKIKI